VSSIGVGIVGFWHVHAGDYAREAERHPGTHLVAGWDADPEMAREGTAALGIEREDSLDALLARPDVDAVTITTATSDHTDVIGRALRAGKHVFSEKLLAPTVAECEQLAAEAAARGLRLVVSLPRLSEPSTVTARRLIDEGALGTVTYARVRMAHDGWLAGWLPERFADPVAAIGGAFADLGCHPAYLVQLFLGATPRTVSATYGAFTGHAVEDNAVVVAGYENGSVGVAEASFVTTPGAFAFEVRGTEGTLLFGLGREELIGKGGRFGETWTVQELSDPPAAPFALWVDAIEGRADTAANVAAAIDLTRLVAAANASASEHRVVDLDVA
jgi:predicted dehydrogenase